ncbi:MAG TPA: ABC transporter ATP-binding protein [Longimicrobiaceae bacterium]|nr:ABC transporter ATP-binding protein [Longimicrobiaceae bacterium]
MSEIAIRVEGLGKRFRLAPERRTTMLREAIVRGLRSAGGRLAGRGRRADEEFWALRDVSFQVPRGEAMGIVGGNGAGKSTLLKVLARITEPTEGDAWIHGRVGSLLEVGTGFHSELSGRENTYLNGAILGMKRAEIDRKFDEIVAFAGVEQFIDTPVKHYSSGMYLRLAFAVAAHLEPEILIVDEVLAVGDAEFQKKCLGKMSEVAQDGRTVLFVSHNMDAVQRLCSRCILLEGGRIVEAGAPADVVRRYLSRELLHPGPGEWVDVSRRPREGTGEGRFAAARYAGPGGAPAGPVVSGGPVEVTVQVDASARLTVDSLGVTFFTVGGTKLVNADTAREGRVLRLDRGRNEVVVEIEALHLNPGVYPVGLWLASSATGVVFDYVESAFEVTVEGTGAGGFGSTPRSDGYVPCRFRARVVQPAAAGGGVR